MKDNADSLKYNFFAYSFPNSIRMVNLVETYYLNLESSINHHLWQRKRRCKNNKYFLKTEIHDLKQMLYLSSEVKKRKKQ